MTYESPAVLKKRLFSLISEMQTIFHIFVIHLENDFIRNRKLSFSDTIQFLLSMKGNTVCKEWLDFWDFSPDTASVSALSQQRQKVFPDAMDYLFHSFNATFSSLDTYRVLRLLACDGFNLAIAHNPNDKDIHRCHNSLERYEKGYSQLHLNDLYDCR